MKYEQTIPLQAQVENHCIMFWWLDKWRGVRYYNRRQIPSAKIIREALVTFRLNAGLDADQKIEIASWYIA
jgi:hypothetical protein